MNLDEVANRPWDAVVIGAGPAGATAAVALARRGLRTLLVERKAFPRPKVCGGCLNGRSLAALEAVGLGDLCDRLGATRTARVRVRLRGRSADLPLPGGRAVSRGPFDAALAAAAVEAGAASLTEARAVVLPEAFGTPASAPRRVRLEQAGVSAEIETAVVLAADGLSHPSLESLPEFAPRVAAAARLGLGALVENPAWDEPPGTIAMAVGRAGYVGAVRVEGGLLNVAAAVDAAALRSLGPAGAVAAIVAEAGGAAVDPGGVARWQGTPPLTRRTPRTAARRLFLLGDAAGYVEPFTGEGMAWALTAALAVGPFAERAAGGWEESSILAWDREYARRVRRRQRPCRVVAGLLRRPLAASLALSALSAFPALARPVVRYLESPPELPATA